MHMTFTTIVSAAELAQRLSDPRWLLIDCRHDLMNPDAGRAAWQADHLPGARHAHLDLDLSDKRPGPNGEFRGRHPLPERAAFIDTLRGWGVNDDTQVVAYDAQGGMFAARLWWMLRWVGHAHVAVLDGGMQAWTAQGGELTTDVAPIVRGNIHERPALVSTVDATDVVASLARDNRTLIDGRAPDRFRGENETIDPVGGRIPGAKNRFFKDNLGADGRFKPAAELRADFSTLTDSPAGTIMYCGSGATACHNLLAMEIAGLANAALYPGSWSEWSADPARPVATGA
jgi:thiosulfate/3-mercaptopyruvate sulfurtransferase